MKPPVGLRHALPCGCVLEGIGSERPNMRMCKSAQRLVAMLAARMTCGLPVTQEDIDAAAAEHAAATGAT